MKKTGNQKPVRVLISSNLVFPHIGGVENSIRHLAVEALELGDQVIIASSDMVTGLPIKTGTDYDLLTKKVYRSFSSVPQPIRILLSFLSAVALYRRIRAEFSPDFVVVRFHFNAVAARVAGLRRVVYLVPGIVKYQDSTANLGRWSGFAGWVAFSLHKFLQRLALRFSDRVFVFSRNMGEQVASISPKLTVGYLKPGVDTKRFVAKNVNITDEEPICLLCVGRLVAAKGFHFAIEALRFLPSRYILTILGDGEELASLVTFAEKLEVRDRVYFHGATSEPEKYYAQSHLFLMTSLYEPFGQTILEAGASALPIVAFKANLQVNTATEQILGDRAIYAAEPDARFLASAIETATYEYYQCRRKSATELANHISKNYSWRTLYEDLKGSVI